jgi:hypothetical protein
MRGVWYLRRRRVSCSSSSSSSSSSSTQQLTAPPSACSHCACARRQYRLMLLLPVNVLFSSQNPRHHPNFHSDAFLHSQINNRRARTEQWSSEAACTPHSNSLKASFIVLPSATAISFFNSSNRPASTCSSWKNSFIWREMEGSARIDCRMGV